MMLSRGGVALAACCVLTAALCGQAADAVPAQVEVHLPAEALLEFDGARTRSTGAVRTFHSPPVAVGYKYSYTLKATWRGKEIVKVVQVNPTQLLVVDLRPDFAAAPPPVAPKEAPPQPAAAEAPKEAAPKTERKPGPYPKPGFVTLEEDGRLWVFKEGSKELAAFERDGELTKHIIRVGAGPKGTTLKAPDADTLLAYLAAKAGFVTLVEEGRLWVFAADSKELAEFRKHGELAKHITRIGAGPGGVSLKAPDVDTLEKYLKAAQDSPR